jgi:hypothetical protein
MSTILFGILAYILLTIPLAVIIGDCLKRNRRAYPALHRKDRL